jgi:hypothetical protein
VPTRTRTEDPSPSHPLCFSFVGGIRSLRHLVPSRLPCRVTSTSSTVMRTTVGLRSLPIASPILLVRCLSVCAGPHHNAVGQQARDEQQQQRDSRREGRTHHGRAHVLTPPPRATRAPRPTGVCHRANLSINQSINSDVLVRVCLRVDVCLSVQAHALSPVLRQRCRCKP